MTAALDRLWAQYQPQMIERVEIMEAANRALAADTLTMEQRSAANSAAHKLAGVLGTFGLTRGTVLAREAEMDYSGDAEPDPASLARLVRIAEELRAIIASRKDSSRPSN